MVFSILQILIMCIWSDWWPLLEKHIFQNWNHFSIHSIRLSMVRENFCWIKISPSPATFVSWKNFHQCGKGRHILYTIFNTGKKLTCQHFCQWEQVAKLAKSFFFLAKIFMYYGIGISLAWPLWLSTLRSVYYDIIILLQVFCVESVLKVRMDLVCYWTSALIAQLSVFYGSLD